MSKTINITDIKIKEVNIALHNGVYTMSVVYALLDDAGDELSQKRIDIGADKIVDKTVDKIEKVVEDVVLSIKEDEGV